MNETAETKIASVTRGRVRVGRPPLEHAGEVEERILEAAGKIFLERGFDGASIDLIALTARSGKPTIYSRFPNKEALFAAAVAHKIDAKNARLAGHRPMGATIADRLASIGVAVLRETLTEEFVGLFRVAIAEARRFPDLIAGLTRMAREHGREIVARLLTEVSECGEPNAFPAFSQDRCAVAAGIFAELILLPLLMRAFSGEPLETLYAEIDSHVARRIAFFLAACRNGGIS